MIYSSMSNEQLLREYRNAINGVVTTDFIHEVMDRFKQYSDILDVLDDLSLSNNPDLLQEELEVYQSYQSELETLKGKINQELKTIYSSLTNIEEL